MEKHNLSILGFILLFLSACTGQSEIGATMEEEFKQHSCTKDTEEKRSAFILECLKNANPLSDEEPEDWIPLCGDMAKDTFCPLDVFIAKKKCIYTDSFTGRCLWNTARTISVKPKSLENSN